MGQGGQELILRAVRSLGVQPRLLRLADVVLERIDVHQRQDGAVDTVVGRPVRPDLHAIPATVVILDLRFPHGHRVDDPGDLLVEIDDRYVGLDVVEGAADVAGEDVQDPARVRRVPPDPPLHVEDEDRNLHCPEHVHEIAVDLGHLLITVMQLVVDGGELLVGGLKLFLRRLQLLVHTLQLFIAGDELFVGRAEIVVGAALLCDQRR